MQIKIVSVGDKETKGTGRKVYDVFPLTYIAGDGKVQVKKILSFTNAEVFKILLESKKGDTFDVKTEKNSEGYWEWTGIATAVVEASSAAGNEKTKWVPDSEKQRSIIRQNSLTNAVNYVTGGVEPLSDTDRVLEIAARFEEWVTRPISPPFEEKDAQT